MWSSDPLPLPSMFQAPSTGHHSFISRPNNIPLIGHTDFSVLFISWWDNCVASTLGLLRTSTYKVLCESMFHLGMYLIDLLGHKTAQHLSLALRNWQVIFQGN